MQERELRQAVTTSRPAAPVDEMMEGLAADLLASRRVVPLHQVLELADGGPGLSRATLEQLCTELRSQGYLVRALDVARRLERLDEGATSLRRTERIAGEVAVLKADAPALSSTRETTGSNRPGAPSVVLLMGRSLPDVSTTYATRVHQIALGLRGAGWEVRVVTEPGYRSVAGGNRSEEIDGVGYHRLPGPARGETPLDRWLACYRESLMLLLERLAPSALVAHTDFLNALPALACGAAMNLPVVYDVAADWDASWYRRQQSGLGWPEPELLAVTSQGLPERYELRRGRERDVWRSASAVVVSSGDRSLAAEVRAVVTAAPVIQTGAGGDLEATLSALRTVLEPAGPGARPETNVSARTDAISALTARARVDRRRLESSSRTDAPAIAAATLSTGWAWRGLPAVSLDLPIVWKNLCSENRSQGYRLHGWSFMHPLLEQVERSSDSNAFRWCVDRAVSWCREVVTSSAPPAMAWYDMAVAHRAPILAFLLERGLGADVLSPDETRTLYDGVLAHQEELFRPSSFNAGNNHGFYTAVAQIAFARRLPEVPGMLELAELGRDRLRAVAEGQFAADGGHREHSIEYHQMLVDGFLAAAEDDLVVDEPTLALVDRAAGVTGWFVRPDGELEQIGDSAARELPAASRSTRDPVTRFLASGGAEGTPPSEESLLLPHSGYAIVRSPAPQAAADLPRAAFMTMAGTFHSQAHKHADDLSITWFDSGAEILVDSGRFGYLDLLPVGHEARERGFFYGRPERQYVESTAAHNTLSADGEPHDRRHREPYGSAVRSVDRVGSDHVVVGEVDHGHWRHRRTATLTPGRRLEVRDEVTSLDGNRHAFRTWWNLPGDLDVRRVGGEGLVLEGPAYRLTVTATDGAGSWSTVRGRQSPLLGWRSRRDFELTPAWNLSREITATAHTFTTTFEIASAR